MSRYTVGWLGYPGARHVVLKPDGTMLCHADGGFVASPVRSRAEGVADALNLGGLRVDERGRLLPHPAIRHMRAQRQAAGREG